MARWRSLGLAVLFVVGAVYSAAPAHASGAHRALVVVDTGATTYRQVITFTEDSVTGIHALELAGAKPLVYTYSGQGGAVCRLFGVGRDSGPGCLGGADGDNRYWAYFRAPSGTSSFTYSRAGAGSVQVHDGDVEGWKFGTGQAPGWSAVPAPSTTTTVAPAPSPTAPPSRGPGSGSAVGPSGPASVGSGPPSVGGPVSAPIVSGAADLNAAGSSTTTVPATASVKPKTSVRGKQASKRSTGRVASGPVSSSSGDGSGAGSLAWFALVAAALGVGVVSLRRMRRARSA